MHATLVTGHSLRIEVYELKEVAMRVVIVEGLVLQ